MDLEQYRKKYGANGFRVLAEKAGTSVAYLDHIRAGRKDPRDRFKAKLIVASGGELTGLGLSPILCEAEERARNVRPG